MALCINCPRQADWVFMSGGIKPRYYCDGHLPHAYRGTSAVTPAPKQVPQAPASPE